MVDGEEQARAFAANEALQQGVAPFGDALQALKAGLRVTRTGWTSKGMWLSLSGGTRDLPAEKFWSPHNRAFAAANGGSATVLPCITMKTAAGEILMGWLASQTDMLAEDWCVVSEGAPRPFAQDTRSRGEPRVPRRDERLPGSRPHP